MSLRPEERKAHQNFVGLATRIHPDAASPNILRLSAAVLDVWQARQTSVS